MILNDKTTGLSSNLKPVGNNGESTSLRIITLILLLCLQLHGCGIYTFSGHGIAGIETISVEPFDNETAEFGIRDELTDALINKLLSSRTLTVAGQANADAVLRGKIISVTDRPLTFREDEEVTENQVIVTVEVILIKPGKSEPLWEGRLVGEGNYAYQTGSPEEREEGIEQAIERLVQDLVNRLTSDW